MIKNQTKIESDHCFDSLLFWNGPYFFELKASTIKATFKQSPHETKRGREHSLPLPLGKRFECRENLWKNRNLKEFFQEGK